MINYLENKLNPYETLAKYLPYIIETFNEFYGVDVSDKMKNITILCTRTPDGLERYLNEIKEEYTNYLIKNFCKNFDIGYTKSNINNIFGFSRLPFENINNMPIMKYDKFKKNYDFDVKKIIKYIKKLHFQYQNYLKKYSKYFNYIENANIIRKKLSKKYMDKLVIKFKSIFPKEEVELYFKTGHVKGKMYNYLSSNIYITPLINAFTSESTQILNNNFFKKWEKEKIKKDRIEFFKKMGLDLGNNYYDYINSKEALFLTPSKVLIEDILDTKEEYELKMYQEYYESLEEYKINKAKISEEQLLLDDGYNVSTFLYSDTYTTPNIKKINNDYVIHSIVNINFDYPNEHLDKYIIHELNHAYEAYLTNDSPFSIFSGWDELSSNSNRKYRYFNEIINDLIANEITEKLHQKDIYMFYPKDEAQVTGGTGYDSLRFLVEKFYETFKEDILKSRKGDFNHILNKCGKENFEELNDLINLFKKTWNNLEILNLKADLKHGKDTENTKKYNKILEKLDKIIYNMIEHKKLFEKTYIKGM